MCGSLQNDSCLDVVIRNTKELPVSTISWCPLGPQQTLTQGALHAIYIYGRHREQETDMPFDRRLLCAILLYS